MNIDIENFLPKYPDVYRSKYDVLNPYKSFYKSIYRKKEFYENRLEKTEEFPRESGILLKHQKTIARYMSSHTPYNRLLLVHEMGTGKTCSAIGAIELIRREHSSINGAIIIARGEGILDNFKHELLFRCTGGEYIPEDYEQLSPGEKHQRIRKKISAFYTLETIQKFAKKLKRKTDAQIKSQFSNKIIVIDEVHNLRIRTDKKGTVDIYNQYYRFLHNVDNCKVLLMSGTPMKDGVEEIASVMNLIIPKEEKLPMGEKFLSKFMEQKGKELYILQKDKIPILQHVFKGRVSFLKNMESNVTKEYMGKAVPPLQRLMVVENKMSAFQTKYYDQAYKEDFEKRKGVYINSREASLFVFPDGSYGSRGFRKFIIKKKDSFVLRRDFRALLKGGNSEETLKNIGKYSSKYEAVLREILKRKNKECCFVYSSFVSGSGLILFSLLLELLGYSRSVGNDMNKAPRYAFFAGDTSNAQLNILRRNFNRDINMKGEYTQVILGSRKVSEGYSFKNIQFEAILTPHFNYSETSQALARGIRLNSHRALEEAKITPKVVIMQCASVPDSTTKSIDLIMYKTSEDKDISIHQVIRIIMESAFDCALNYLRNKVTNGKNGSRDCDYMECEFKCNGVQYKNLPDDKLDYSTYQLYYTDPKFPRIYAQIEKLLRKNIKLSLNDIVRSLKNDYSEDRIINSLSSLIAENESDKEDKNDYDYLEFLDVYARTSIQQLMKEIELLFQTYFYLDLDTIRNHFPQFRDFELITALRSLINNNVAIKNKYGLTSYIRESDNIYFLTDTLSSMDNVYTGYYTQYPTISPQLNIEDIYSHIKSEKLPGVIREICKCQTAKQFSQLIKIVPLEIQESLIESTIIAKEKEEKKDDKKLPLVSKYIMDYFSGYIKNIDNMWISSLLKEKGTMRCKKKGEKERWRECNQNEIKMLENQEQKKREEVMNNPTGIVGLYNDMNGAFCLIDMSKSKGSARGDSRKIMTGLNCRNWKAMNLIKLINRLKIPYPDDFHKEDSEGKLKEQISSTRSVAKLDLSGLSKDELRRILYWSSKTVSNLCKEIRKWLTEKGLVLKDTMCGVQSKKKAKDKKGPKKTVYTIREIRPDTRERRDEIKEMGLVPLIADCINDKKYKYNAQEDRFYVALVRTIAAVIVVRGDRIIWACMPQAYRNRKNIRTTAIKELVKYSKINTIQIDTTFPQANRLERMYKSFGFVQTGREGTMILMEM